MNEQYGGYSDEEFLEAVSKAEEFLLCYRARVVAGSSDAFMDFSNSLGFKQIKGSSGLLEFGDKNFVRGRPELMDEMQKIVSMERINANEEEAKEEVKERFFKNLIRIIIDH